MLHLGVSTYIIHYLLRILLSQVMSLLGINTFFFANIGCVLSFLSTSTHPSPTAINVNPLSLLFSQPYYASLYTYWVLVLRNLLSCSNTIIMDVQVVGAVMFNATDYTIGALRLSYICKFSQFSINGGWNRGSTL